MINYRDEEIEEILKDYLDPILSEEELIEEIENGIGEYLWRAGIEESEEEDLSLEEEALAVLQYMIEIKYFKNIPEDFNVWDF